MRCEASCLLLLVAFCGICLGDVYNEDVSFRRLPNDRLLAHFRFDIRKETTDGSTYTLFPRIMAELAESHNVDELRVSLAQGRWFSNEYGSPPDGHGPTGALVTAWMSGNETSVDEQWSGLVNSLNGIFCTALSSMVPSHTSAPTFSFSPTGRISASAKLRVGTVPRESVCTENLTPWKKLLPCKEDGIAHLLNPLKLYSSYYHSIGLHLFRACEVDECNWQMQLDSLVVFGANMKTYKLDWSFSEIFGRDVASACRVASSSTVRVLLDREKTELKPSVFSEVIDEDGLKWGKFDVLQSTLPLALSAFYNEESTVKRSPVDVISVTSALGGVGQFEGTIHVRITNPKETAERVLLMQQLPWYTILSYRTMALRCFSIKYPDIPYEIMVTNRSFTPAISRQRPALLEMTMVLPPRANCRLTVDFQKAFLRLREYPPDANHGLYISAAVVTLFDSNARIYSNALLVTMPVPDFSMPFNVICLVATAVSLCFGPIHSFTSKLLIPSNMELPPNTVARRLFRGMILVLIALALYAQYHEMGMNEIRRLIEDFFERMNNL